MPARKKRTRKYSKKKSKPVGIYFRYAIIALFIFALPLLYKNIFVKKYFDSQQKLTIAVQQDEGGVSLFILDPIRSEITTVVIPGDTEVEVYGSLGKWKLKSVWELGKNKKLDGKLLTNTLTHYLKFPTYVWADEKALDLAGNNLSKMLLSAVTPFETNLNLADKFAISLFSLKVKNTARREIDLARTTFIKSTELADGEAGYTLSGQESPILYSYFSDVKLTEKSSRILIIDATGKSGLAKNTGEILEVMGGKIVAINVESEKEIFCEVSGRDSKMNSLISNVLDCAVSKIDYEGNYDLELVLGNKFVR